MRGRTAPGWPSSAPAAGFRLWRRHRGLRLGSGGLGSRLPFLRRALLCSLLRRGSRLLGSLLGGLLGGFLCALLGSLLRRFLRGLLRRLLRGLLLRHYGLLGLFSLLALLTFFSFAIWSSCCRCPCLSSASNSPWARPGRHFFEVPSRSIPCPGAISGQTLRVWSRGNRMPIPPSTCGADVPDHALKADRSIQSLADRSRLWTSCRPIEKLNRVHHRN